MMNFDQGEFSFDQLGSESGYAAWQMELQIKKEKFEARYGIILGSRVRVQLRGELSEIEGVIRLADNKEPANRGQLKLAMGKRTFTLGQIESISKLKESIQ